MPQNIKLLFMSFSNMCLIQNIIVRNENLYFDSEIISWTVTCEWVRVCSWLRNTKSNRLLAMNYFFSTVENITYNRFLSQEVRRFIPLNCYRQTHLVYLLPMKEIWLTLGLEDKFVQCWWSAVVRTESFFFFLDISYHLSAYTIILKRKEEKKKTVGFK